MPQYSEYLQGMMINFQLWNAIVLLLQDKMFTDSKRQSNLLF